MPIEDFDIKEDLGKGSFGQVVKVIRKSDGEVYAMKQVLSTISRSRSRDSRKRIKRMRSIKSDSSHPSTIPM